MSSTISVGKASAAFRRPDGTVIYTLFEKTYESNVHPHDPRWGCIALGEYADVMRAVFLGAACCEGGSLQGSGRRLILPENYIAAWRRAIAESGDLPDMPITIHVGGCMSPIDKDRLAEAYAALAAIGREDVVGKIAEGGAEVRLHQDIDVVLALYGVKKLFAPWKVLDYNYAYSMPKQEYAPTAVVGKVTAPAATVYRIDDNHLVGKIGSGTWGNLGWAYAAVYTYVMDVVYALEMQQTGCAKRLIADFRGLCKSAGMLPGSTKITVTREPGGELSKWYLERPDRLAQKLGLVGEGQQAPKSFQCEFADVMAKGAMYELQSLSNAQLVWDVPVEQVEGQPVQADLLSAAA